MARAEDSSTVSEGEDGSDLSIQEIGEQLAQLPGEQRIKILEAAQELRTLTQVETTALASYSDPMPLPEHFAEYERIAPGTAERIVRMAEREQEIRATTMEGSVKNERRRIDGAILLGVGILAISGYATYLNEPVIAVPLGLAGIATLVLRWLFTGKRREG